MTRPGTGPMGAPGSGPMARPGTGPAVRPATGPIARPMGRPVAPGARPAKKAPAGGKGRQAAAFKVAAIATSALFLVPVVAGITEIHLHGFDFFVFRSIGAGETGPNGLTEDQGPGQPDAPKPTPSPAKKVTVKTTSGTHKTITVHKKTT